MVEYKKIFDLELEDEGVFEGERYKISKIEKNLGQGRVILTLYNNKKVVCNVDAEMFAVKFSSLTIDSFVELYNEAKTKRLI